MALSNAPGKPKASVLFTQRLRRLLITAHMVLGLTAGLLLSLMGLTGSLLVFRHEMEGLTEPTLRRVHPTNAPQAPLESVVASVHQVEPRAEIRQLFLGETPENTHEIWLAGTDKRVYVDPYTARVLGTRDDSRSFTGQLFALHSKLLSGETGEQIVGWGGFVLFALCISGVILWWPAHLRQLSDRLRIKWSAGIARVNYDLHRTGGFYAALLLALLALTGTALVFDDAFKVVATRLTNSPTSPPRPKVPPTPPGESSTVAPLSLLLARTEEALPGGILRRVSFPAKPGTPVVIRKRLPGDPHPNGMSYIYLDPRTATVLRVDQTDKASAAQWLMNLRYPIHIGHWGGLLTQCLHAAVGLMPTVLFVTGCRMWWARTRARWRRRASAPQGK